MFTLTPLSFPCSSLSVDRGGKLQLSCLLYNHLSNFILNKRVLKMILFGIFCGRLKIYICWLAPTCLYLEEADTQQSAYVSGKPCSFSLKPLSICSHPLIWASLPLLLELKCTTKKEQFSGNAGCPGAGSPWSLMSGLRDLVLSLSYV